MAKNAAHEQAIPYMVMLSPCAGDALDPRYGKFLIKLSLSLSLSLSLPPSSPSQDLAIQ
jgi:hypothetical protein